MLHDKVTACYMSMCIHVHVLVTLATHTGNIAKPRSDCRIVVQWWVTTGHAGDTFHTIICRPRVPRVRVHVGEPCAARRGGQPAMTWHAAGEHASKRRCEAGGVGITMLVHLCRHTHPLGRWPAAKNRHVFAYSSAFIAQATRAPSRALQSCEGSAERSNSFQLERAMPGAALRPPPQASRPLLRASGTHQRRTRQPTIAVGGHRERAAGDASIGSRRQGLGTSLLYRNVQLVTAAEDLPTPPEPPPRRKVA